MRTQTVAGPLNTEQAAIETMNTLGFKNHSVFSRAKNKVDPKTGEEYTDFEDVEWFVERLLDVMPDKIFGYGVEEFLKKQYR